MNKCPICHKPIDENLKMCPDCRKLMRSTFMARYYRHIVYSLVMVNTGLIVFLVVYIWTYGLAAKPAGPRETGNPALSTEVHQAPDGTVILDRLVVWSKIGGVSQGGASRGVLHKGETVRILDRKEIDGSLWYEISGDGQKGWVPADGVRYIIMPAPAPPDSGK